MFALIASAALAASPNLAPSAPTASAVSNALAAANAQRPSSAQDAPRGGLVALQAGTIYLVDEGRVLKGGANAGGTTARLRGVTLSRRLLA